MNKEEFIKELSKLGINITDKESNKTAVIEVTAR